MNLHIAAASLQQAEVSEVKRLLINLVTVINNKDDRPLAISNFANVRTMVRRGEEQYHHCAIKMLRSASIPRS